MLLAAVPGDEGVDVELPLAAVVVHESGKKVRGNTPHYEYIKYPNTALECRKLDFQVSGFHIKTII